MCSLHQTRRREENCLSNLGTEEGTRKKGQNANKVAKSRQAQSALSSSVNQILTFVPVYTVSLRLWFVIGATPTKHGSTTVSNTNSEPDEESEERKRILHDFVDRELVHGMEKDYSSGALEEWLLSHPCMGRLQAALRAKLEHLNAECASGVVSPPGAKSSSRTKPLSRSTWNRKKRDDAMWKGCVDYLKKKQKLFINGHWKNPNPRKGRKHNAAAARKTLDAIVKALVPEEMIRFSYSAKFAKQTKTLEEATGHPDCVCMRKSLPEVEHTTTDFGSLIEFKAKEK